MTKIVLKLVFITCIIKILLGCESVAVAQPIGKMLDVRGYGFDIPPGEIAMVISFLLEYMSTLVKIASFCYQMDNWSRATNVKRCWLEKHSKRLTWFNWANS